MKQSLMASNQSENHLLFVPLGGCGEIGMNLTLYGFGPEGQEKWIIADLGVTFGAEEHMPGIDVVMPDPSFIEARKRDLLGIVLTHGHEDHIGAVPHLWPRLKCPVYATPFTAALLRGKLEEHGLEDDVKLITVPLNGKIKLGPFDISLITLTHSILEPNALAIKTPLGTVLHTGDWKIDADPMIGEMTDEKTLRALGDEGVLAMACDSTNVFVPGESGSEGSVRESLTELVAGKKGRVAVTSFASNVARIETLAHVAEACGRHPVLVGRAMHKLTAAAREAGYLADLPGLVPMEDASSLPPETLLYICTGSQGEPRAALARIAEGTHPDVALESGDTLIFSSRVIPGNERAIYALMNAFVAKGVEVIAGMDEHLHVSGHPCRGELARMYQWVRPQLSIPVHGELRHLHEHAKLARELQIPQAVITPNGAILKLAPGIPQVIDHAPSGRLYLDGNIIIPADDGTVAARKRIAFSGHIVAAIVFDKKGLLASDPRVSGYGLPRGAEGQEIDDEIKDDLEDALYEAMKSLPRQQAMSDESVEEIARRAMRGAIRERWNKRPVISVEVIRLEG
jgi:ribonuclease J